MRSEGTPVRLAVPSKGVLEAPTLAFLAQCGLGIVKSNPRQYVAAMPALPQVVVLFQRVADIVTLVEQGEAELGITGYDMVAERRGADSEEEGDGRLMVLHRDLGYGACDLVLAVPETWVDVQRCRDLAEVSAYYREKKGRSLRIATKYPELTRAFLARKGITLFQTVIPQGALEAAPAIGLADMIADLTQTGVTLRENRLRVLEDGLILHSHACLIGNTRALTSESPQGREHGEKPVHVAGQRTRMGGDGYQASPFATATTMLELIDATRQAQKSYLLTAIIRGAAPREVAAMLGQRQYLFGPGTAGVTSLVPMAAPPYQAFPVQGGAEGAGEVWSTVSAVVASEMLLEAVRYLRRIGAEHVHATELAYRFTAESASVKALTERLKRGKKV